MEVRDAAKDLTMHKTSPVIKNYPFQNINTTKLGKHDTRVMAIELEKQRTCSRYSGYISEVELTESLEGEHGKRTITLGFVA